MPFSLKHNSLTLKMSVIWKCFDGIQREEISISDVRNEFRFLLWKVSFQCQFDCKLFARYS